MRWIVVLGCVVVAAAPAAAQSTYVGAALVGDIARFSKVETENRTRGDSSDSSLDGEALALGVTFGRAIGDQWGVELEFVRSGEIERHNRNPFRILPAELPSTIIRGGLPGLTPVLPGGIPVPLPIPTDFGIEEKTEQQQTTVGALAWVRHDVGSRVELAYLGGITFLRTELEREIRFTDSRLLIFPPISSDTTTIDYAVAPTVGVDAHFKFGEHTAVVTGVRMHAVTLESRRGWLIRPSAGLRWRF